LISIFEDLVEGRCRFPFEVLGIHQHEAGGFIVRAWLPEAWSARVARGDRFTEMSRAHPRGVFEASFPDEHEAFVYRLSITRSDGSVRLVEDPYRFGPVLSREDLALFARGRDFRLFEKYGAHVLVLDGVGGVHFSVWAPGAEAVSVIGSFNDWDGTRHPSRLRAEAGIWELFIPGVPEGALYKFKVRTYFEGRSSEKADPHAFAMEPPPGTASIVRDLRGFAWTDGEWLAKRRERQAFDRPISIYEVHLGSWRRKRRVQNRAASAEENTFLSYEELARTLVPYAKDLGYTHLELLPVTEHPFDGSWGYQTVGYFAPTSRFGKPEDFQRFVEAAHRAEIGILLDWVPGHFPRDGHGLVFFDGTHLYEHEDPRRGVHPDWGTYVFDFSRPEVRAFLVSSALFWLEHYHADGLRVDAVASMLYLDFSRRPGEWLPNVHGGRENLEAIEFLRTLNGVLHEECPGTLICAEESSAWPGVTRALAHGGLGFDLKWNMGWMNDTLRYARLDPLLRRRHQEAITFSLTYAFTEKFLLPLSHDEVVHGKRSLLSKMPGDDDATRFANLRLLYGTMYAHPGKKLLFMGGELGQWREWSHERELDWELLEHAPHVGLRDWVRELNRLYTSEPALFEEEGSWEGFEWIECSDRARAVVAFVRRSKSGALLVVILNFTPISWESYRLGVPRAGSYRVRLNSDDARFAGWGVELPEILPTRDEAANGFPHSIELTVPALSALFLEEASTR
jgi:1,4-alpha-glucan branching enzyme